MTQLRKPLKELFLLAVEVPLNERSDWLNRECVGNAELRQQLQAMLAVHDTPNSLLDQPVIGNLDAAADTSPIELPGTQIGPYKILEQIGEGGMGVVYMAEQVEPVRRKVALKIIKQGMDTRQVIARFEAERQALCLMDHPNIAKVLEAGTTETGRPYFVMELVRGLPITQYCDQQQLSPRQRLEMFLTVCQAIQHAHQKGIIHRDIKPANVLVAEYDGRPVTKVIDFGVAKAVGQPLTEKTLFTGFGQVVGTLEYMSPEQARVNQLDIDTRSDIYALGVLLYELLTGSTPFDKQRLRTAAWDEILRIIREEEPPKPSTRLTESREALPSISAQRHSEPGVLTRMVRGDLDWIVMKALEKERNRRYETASALARDIERHLANELIEACPPSTRYRLYKFASAHRAALMAASMTALCLILGIAVSSWQALRAIRAERAAQDSAEVALAAQVNADQKRTEAEQERLKVDAQRQEADKQRQAAQTQRDAAEQQRLAALSEKRIAQQNAVTSQLLLGKIAHSNGDLADALTWYLQAYRSADPDDPRRTSARNLIGAWGDGLKQTLVHEDGVHGLAVSDDGRTLLTKYFGCRAQFWDLTTGLPIGSGILQSGDAVSVQLSHDGSFALVGDWEGANVWDRATGKLRYPRLEHEVREDTVVGPVLSPDGRTIVTRSPFTGIRLWDAETGKPRGESLPLGNFVGRMVFSPDSKRVAALGGDLARVWDVEKGQPIGEPWPGATDLAFHPSRNVIAVCHRDGKLILQDLDAGQKLAELAHDRSLNSVAFDRDGSNLITQDGANGYLWLKVCNEQRERRVLTHGGQLITAQFSAENGRILTASPLLQRVWKIGADAPVWERSVPSHLIQMRSDRVRFAELSPDGHSVLLRTENETATVLSVDSGRLLARESHVAAAAFSRDGRSLFAGSRDGWVRVYAINTSDPRRIARRVPAENCSGGTTAISPDGKLIFTVGREKSGIFRLDTGEPVGKPLEGLHHDWKDAVTGAAFSPDNRLLVTAMMIGGERRPGQLPGRSTYRATIWDVATSSPVAEPIPLSTGGLGIGFDVTEENVHVGPFVIDIRRRALRTFPPAGVAQGHKTIADLSSSNDSGIAPLWNNDRNEPTTLQMPIAGPRQARLSTDGRRLLIVNSEGMARVYDALSLTPAGPEFQSKGYGSELSRNGRYALFASINSLRLWDTQTGRPCGDNLQNEMAKATAAFRPDGTALVTFWHFSAQAWDCATGMMLGLPMPMPSNSTGRPVFSHDGQTFYLSSGGLEVWRFPPPAIDDPERLRLSIEVRTGVQVDPNSTIEKLSRPDWLARKRQLEQLGGQADVVVARQAIPTADQAQTPVVPKKPAETLKNSNSDSELQEALKAEEQLWQKLAGPQQSLRDFVTIVLVKSPTLKDPQVITAIYLLSLGRAPTADELQQATTKFTRTNQRILHALPLARELVQRAEFHKGIAATIESLRDLKQKLKEQRGTTQIPIVMTMEDLQKFAAKCAASIKLPTQTDTEFVDLAFLLTTSRFPNEMEGQQLANRLKQAANREGAFADIFVFLLNSRDFLNR